MAFRWLDAEQTTIRRESDGSCITPDNPPSDAYLEALAAGIEPFRRWGDLAAAKAELTASVEARAARLRVAVAGTSDATKLAVYREKYTTALAALGGDTAALAKLAPEASARGETTGALATLVKSLGEAWTNAGLAIDAATQAHKRAIAALASLDAAEAYDIEAGWPG